jgi:integrase
MHSSGAPIGVQQKLMRHAQVATTTNVYGNAQIEEKRKANSNVVRMVLPTMAFHGPATQNSAS